MKPATIVGSGTAGMCLAWQFWFRGFPFRLIDSGITGSSHVAAGLINPVSGKNCTVPEDYAMHYAVAETFYQKIEALLGTQVWYPLEIIRLIAQRDDAKLGKKMREGDAAEWVIRKLEESRWTDASAYLLHHGARLDVPHFLSESRSFAICCIYESHCSLRTSRSANSTRRDFPTAPNAILRRRIKHNIPASFLATKAGGEARTSSWRRTQPSALIDLLLESLV